MLPFARQARHLGRYRQIAYVLGSHGFGYILDQLGLIRLLSLPRRIIMRVPPPVPIGMAGHLREVLIELGPTFVKLGQLLSTRPDVFPPDVVRELGKLQDTVPPFSASVAIATIEAELGKPIDQLFRSFERKPLAAASLGQAHTAVLHSGEEVVVKVQRPDIAQIINTDLSIVSDLAALAQERTEFGKQYDLVELAWEFSATLRDELDYQREAANAERFRRNFTNNPLVHIPTVYWEYTSARILTTERLYGIKINNIEALDATGVNRPRLAYNSLQLILEEIFEHGFFHSDPHPGNFFALPGDIIGAIDFGQVGILDRDTTRHMLRLVMALGEHDSDATLRVLGQMGMLERHNITTSLRRDTQRMIDRYVDRPLKELSIREMGDALAAIARRHHLRMPTPLALLLKTLIMIEGTGVQIDPNLDIFQIARPYAQRALAAQVSPHYMGNQAFEQARDIAEATFGLPRQLSDSLQRLNAGELRVQTSDEGLRVLAGAILGAANRVAVAIVLAALVVGVGLVTLALELGPWGNTVLMVLAIVGGTIALIMGLLLVIAWIRGRSI